MLFRTLLAVVVIGLASSVTHAEAPAGQVSPDKAFSLLRAGNQRFVSGKLQHPNVSAARLKETALDGQHPFATIVSCSDSRVPVELLFDRGIGDLFVVRVAGNVCDTDEIGTVEYGVGHLHTPLLVVLGHTSCGAVTAVVTGAEVHGKIPQLVDNIKPAVAAARKQNPGVEGKDLVPAAIEANVRQGMYDLVRNSDEVRELVEQGKLRVIGGVYNITTGEVQWIGAYPQRRKSATPSADAPLATKKAPAPANKKAPPATEHDESADPRVSAPIKHPQSEAPKPAGKATAKPHAEPKPEPKPEPKSEPEAEMTEEAAEPADSTAEPAATDEQPAEQPAEEPSADEPAEPTAPEGDEKEADAPAEEHDSAPQPKPTSEPAHGKKPAPHTDQH